MKNFFRKPEARVSSRLLVYPTHEEAMYQWRAIVDGEVQAEHIGDLQGLAKQQQAMPGSELVLVLPASSHTLRTLSFTEAERKLYRQTMPYELEDSLAESTEKLHFAYRPISRDLMGIVVVSRAKVEPLLEEFREAGLGVDMLVPEALLLPWTSERQTWLLANDQVVARSGACAGFVCSPQNLELVAAMPGHGDLETAQHLELVVEQGADTSSMEAALESARPGLQVEIKPVDSVSGWMASVLPSEPLNLLQGDLRPALRWRHYWHDWKPVAIAALAAVLVNYAVLIYHYSSAREAATVLEAKKYALAREAIPNGKISSPERQLRAALTQLSSAGPSRFGPMIARVGPALGSEAGYTVRNINYDGGNRSLRLELRANDFQHIEQFRNVMQQRGIEAQLLNSSAQGQGILARLELKESSR
jgi:general secretion pathway protein L